MEKVPTLVKIPDLTLMLFSGGTLAMLLTVALCIQYARIIRRT